MTGRTRLAAFVALLWPMALAFALFFVPFFGGLFATLLHPDFAFHVAPESMLRPLTESYAKGFEGGREASMNAGMARPRRRSSQAQ